MHRRTTPLTLAFLTILIASLSWANFVYAQSARKLLSDGNKLFARGDYQAAYLIFEKGNNKKPSPVFLRSMAFCKLKLYQHKDAKVLLEKYLKKYKKARDKRKLSATLKKLDSVVQTIIDIESTPKGADIYIDAEAAGTVGKTPLTLTIEPGEHTLILKKSGYAITTKNFRISSKQRLKLTTPMNFDVRVKTIPSKANVYAGKNGKLLGTTPFSIALPPGKKLLYFKKRNYVDAEREFNIQASQTLTYALPVTFKLKSTPSNASVKIDNKEVKGKTPLTLTLSPGTHKIEVLHPDFSPFIEDITITPPPSKNTFEAILKGATLSMRSTIDGTVFIDDKKFGKTPLSNKEIKIGKHRIRLDIPGRLDWSDDLNISASSMVDADIQAGSPTWPFWTLTGLTAATATAGSVFGIISLIRAADYEEHPDKPGMCINQDGTGEPFSCSLSTHHASTAFFISAGVLAVATAIYYFVWMKPKAKIKTKTSDSNGSRKNAKPIALPLIPVNRAASL